MHRVMIEYTCECCGKKWTCDCEESIDPIRVPVKNFRNPKHSLDIMEIEVCNECREEMKNKFWELYQLLLREHGYIERAPSGRQAN